MLERLTHIIKQLRDPEKGCPWDQKQTLASLAPYTIEEAYETAHAAEQNPDALCEELGDLLFHIVFYAQIASEQGLFELKDIEASAIEKLTRRHPHVFGDETITSAKQQSDRWEQHKRAERQDNTAGLLDDIDDHMPALTHAIKLQKRARSVGFDWQDVDTVMAKVDEELAELKIELAQNGSQKRIEHETGDLLLATSNLARHLGLDPEASLRIANQRFISRFKKMEEIAGGSGKPFEDHTLDEMEMLWQQAKLALES